LRAVDLASVTIALAVTALTTLCCARRWQTVARGLGMPLRLPVAVAAYYRSQFFNTVLPGGVLGDVHRGVDHGAATSDVARGLRAVAWERTAGQVVQALVSLVVLAALPSPARRFLPVVLLAAAAFVIVLTVVAWLVPRTGPSRSARARRLVAHEVRRSVLGRRAWPAITFCSVASLAGHAGIFVLAARAAGSHASILVLLPLALLTLLAAALPTNFGGWGPREGVAAWTFAAAGLGAERGVAAATAFGVLVFVACLPGVLVTAVAAARRPRVSAPRRTRRRLVGAHSG
jgi:uncharacterized membrane protein YbhN (UPF0104 family)